MERREFLKMGMFSLTGLALSPGMGIPTIFEPSEFSEKPGTFNLFIRDAFVEMINLERVYSWVFATEEFGPKFPGLLIMGKEGQRMRISVINRLEQDHSFFIPGVVDSGPIKPGATAQLDFTAPPAGSYIYFDKLNAPVNRVLGLHGMMVIMP
ncbi:MAG: multicopper oxidase domain-containing protein, partial [Syntrophobacteraceae bacterium]